MFRFYVIALLFSLSNTLFAENMTSGEVNNHQFKVSILSLNVGTISKLRKDSSAIVKPKHAELMPTSMAILLIAVGFALMFLDDHLRKSKNRKK